MSNVKDFGAAGDGLADDTAALQHAIAEGDGHLELPRGSYRITRPLVVPLQARGPFALSGSHGQARIVMTGPGPALHLVGTHDQSADPESFREAVWDRERMPTVSAVEILGGHDEADGIRLEGTMQATISGVLIRRCRYGVHLVKRNRNVLIADSHVYHGRGAAIGIYFDGVNLHQTNIVGCHVSYCRHAGIKLQRSEVRNLQITGCDIEYNFDVDNPDSADVWIDARESTIREGTIASNTIQAKESPGGANIRMEGPPLDDSRGAGLWTITGNILQSQAYNLLLRNCRGVVVTGNTFASAFERSALLDRCRNIVISANTFDHNPDYTGARIDGLTLKGCAGVNLTGLILEATRAGGAESGGAIEVSGSREVAIQSCQILDPVHRGIEMRNVINSRVSDCTVIDRKQEVTMREAIRVQGEGSGNLVQNSLIGRGVAGALSLVGGSAAERNNQIL